MYTRFAFAALVAALSGAASASPALSFAPATAGATVPAQTARPVVLDATIHRMADFAGLSQIHVRLADDSVFQEAYVTPGASDKALVALYTSEKLTPGSYKGKVSLRLCKDEACTQQFEGSPVQLPYAIEVQTAGK